MTTATVETVKLNAVLSILKEINDSFNGDLSRAISDIESVSRSNAELKPKDGLASASTVYREWHIDRDYRHDVATVLRQTTEFLQKRGVNVQFQQRVSTPPGWNSKVLSLRISYDHQEKHPAINPTTYTRDIDGNYYQETQTEAGATK